MDTQSIVVSYRNSTSNHNLYVGRNRSTFVVSYRNSTSNHNEELHRNNSDQLYLIEILHQTTTLRLFCMLVVCCILSKFYIKPQLRGMCSSMPTVVSYRNSTSNHNYSSHVTAMRSVVSYRNSTSNHNFMVDYTDPDALYLIEILHQTTTLPAPPMPEEPLYLIEILHQTTTRCCAGASSSTLYLIEILHQTTTESPVFIFFKGCILSKFYIKPQLSKLSVNCLHCCILSKFYIKPQLGEQLRDFGSVVSYRNSTSNHNYFLNRLNVAMVVSYRNSTSNHNVGPHID